MRGRVYLVGAGPGNPELLTLRAIELLGSADLILHDDLVPPAVLRSAGSYSMVVNVGKRFGRERITQAEINERMIGAARCGLSVVRLKGGDPLIFGRLGEEIDSLRAADVPYEIVPGISAAFAAAAALGIPLTDRRLSSHVWIASGHRSRAGEERRSTHMVPSPVRDTTIVVYMPGPDPNRLRRELLDAGLPPSTPCAVVSRATTPEQRISRSSVGQIHLLPRLEAPAVLLIGPALERVAPRAIAEISRAGA